MSSVRYGIAEWFGRPFPALTVQERRHLAASASGPVAQQPPCPFAWRPANCHKAGGVCSIQQYSREQNAAIGAPAGKPVILCPTRFEEGGLLVRWLSDIVGFQDEDVLVAREVPFMTSTATSRPAGKIDLVVARDAGDRLIWYGLEIQAVYFSGPAMDQEFRVLEKDTGGRPPFPLAHRRPDFRSSSAKRLMPQLRVKVPTLRRWGQKLAVAVDQPFFDAIGGPSANPKRELSDGDIIWLVPELVLVPGSGHQLRRGHWEVLTLEDSSSRLLAAEPVGQKEFEKALRRRLEPMIVSSP